MSFCGGQVGDRYGTGRTGGGNVGGNVCLSVLARLGGMAQAAPAMNVEVAMYVFLWWPGWGQVWHRPHRRWKCRRQCLSFCVGQVGDRYGTGRTGGGNVGGNVCLSVLARLGTGMALEAREVNVEVAMSLFLCWPASPPSTPPPPWKPVSYPKSTRTHNPHIIHSRTCSYLCAPTAPRCTPLTMLCTKKMVRVGGRNRDVQGCRGR